MTALFATLPRRWLAALLLASLSTAAAAQPPASMESVVSPAWTERGGKRAPVVPGTTLRPGDVVLTGSGSRALIRMADGSTVKLGENARFQFSAGGMSTAQGEDNLFRATLRVLTGAFRFTTSAIAKLNTRRNVDIYLPTVTAGIRGTDLWGRATDDREFVVLIEGKIGVRRGSGDEVALDRPLSVFDAPKAAASPSVTSITEAVLLEYARETEIEAGSGALRSGGRWKVTVLTTPDQASALEAYDRLREAGYPANVAPQKKPGQTLYRVRVPGLPSSGDASTLAIRLKSQFGFEEVGVSL